MRYQSELAQVRRIQVVSLDAQGNAVPCVTSEVFYNQAENRFYIYIEEPPARLVPLAPPSTVIAEPTQPCLPGTVEADYEIVEDTK